MRRSMAARRFPGGRGVGSSSGAAPAVINGLKGFSAANYWGDSTTGNPIQLGDNGWIGAVLRTDAYDETDQENFCGNGNLSPNGFHARRINAAFRLLISDGGTLRIVDRGTLVSGMNGKLITVAWTIAPSAIKCFVNGAQVGTTFTTFTSYGTPTAGLRVGNADGGAAMDEAATVCGLAGGSSATPSDAEIATWHADCVAATDIATIDGKTAEAFSANDLSDPLGATWTGRIAGTTLEKNGTGGTLETFAADWYSA